MIRPGEVNWMVAGRGVTHSERTSAETRTGALIGNEAFTATGHIMHRAAG